MIANEINKISYWNEYARWYKLWREHNTYHDSIKRVLFDLIPYGIKILDIGAGDGVLSFPLAEKGFDVTALDPAKTMQEYLYKNALNYSFKINIDSRRFEDLENYEIRQYDLTLACNSLHLTEYGIETALFKIFDSGIESVFLVTEKDFSFNELSLFHPEYKICFNHSYLCESFFAYHSLDELFEHWRFKYKRELFTWEIKKILQSVTCEKEHYWLRDFVIVNIFYWRREYKKG